MSVDTARHAIQTAHPLTPLQEAMLLASVRDRGSRVYQAQCEVEIEGPLDADLLAEAWRRLIRRHPALRSFFAWEGREDPLQVIRADVELPWATLDWRDADPREREERWKALLREDEATAFDLAAAPILRLTLVRLEDERHRLLWSLHHALADGWSGFLVFREMVEEYEALRAGAPLDRPIPPAFGLFVSWLQDRDRGAAEAWWRSQLDGVRDATPLPVAGTRAAGPRRARVERALPPGTDEAVARAASRLRVTPYTLALAAWGLVLDRYHPGEDTLTFGTTVSERPSEIPGVEHTVGLFLNTVPLRIPAPGNTPLTEWLPKVQRTVAEARAHGVGGLGEIGRWAELAPGGVLARSLVVYESFPPELMTPPRGDSIRLAATRISAPSDLPLALLVYPGEDARLELVYDPELYGATQADRLLEAAARALAGLARPGVRTVAEVDLVGDEERARLVEGWSRSPVAEPPVRDVLELFDEAVRAAPAAPALRAGGASLTYEALDGAASRLAHRILREVPDQEALIGIPGERRPDAVVAILACLKAGRGYVPFDPEQPPARLEGILERVARVLAPAEDGRWGALHLSTSGLEREPPTDPGVPREDDRVAYVVFTSGSTGRPKGVVIERGHLARSTCARLAWYGGSPGRFLLLSSLAVDSSVAGLYGTLCAGGCLVLPAPRAEQDAEGLAALIEEASVSTTLLVPGLYRTLLESIDPARLGSLECVVVAGDACPPSLVARHHELLPGVRLVNEYGPSEATVWATAGELRPDDGSVVTIGRPVPFTRVHLLDPEGRPVPVGAPGEICLAGDTVARGYLGGEEAGGFVADPFHPGGRMYRTGDRGRFREDGRLDFLGRLDDQLKVRGFRIEPGEIEGILDGAPGVAEAAVVHRGPRAVPDVDALVRALVDRAGDDAEALLLRLLERT